MTITQYLSLWLRRRSVKPLIPKPDNIRKKEWQRLPTLPKSRRPLRRRPEDDRPPGHRIRWRP
jgi:hypothetical protein